MIYVARPFKCLKKCSCRPIWIGTMSLLGDLGSLRRHLGNTTRGLKLWLTRQASSLKDQWVIYISICLQSLISTTYSRESGEFFAWECSYFFSFFFFFWKSVTFTLAWWTLMRVKTGWMGWKVNMAKDLTNEKIYRERTERSVCCSFSYQRTGVLDYMKYRTHEYPPLQLKVRLVNFTPKEVHIHLPQAC